MVVFRPRRGPGGLKTNEEMAPPTAGGGQSHYRRASRKQAVTAAGCG